MSTELWIWSKEDGFDFTHPATPDSHHIHPWLRLQCALTPVVIDPAKTALLIIDLKNHDLDETPGNDNADGHTGGIQLIWVTAGYSNEGLREMDPGVFKTFNFEPVKDMYRSQKGVGNELGRVTDKDGKVTDAGRVLVEGSWNSWLHDPLLNADNEATMKFLNELKFTTLLFTGIDIDQCVITMGTLQDAYHKDFDTILLRDGYATNSPSYAQWSVEHNWMISRGFLSSCRDFATGAGVAVDQVDEGKATVPNPA
ncbi:hypothetical protein C8A05DRAFT_37004 [Staphylotrichum tortipilum]|uniref:Isochorismatase-like domain-containing protein n=1 Tax=Staphylotrichum tortipilum TaxID=2831512 RepID=A0AAN6MF54_9PEZI|nr:hypothetical protein C8A05DRAFT_37004 [Staphylotrichum longicolle]